MNDYLNYIAMFDLWDDTGNQKSGFFDLEGFGCTDPEHSFPMHLYIPPGKGYRHVCPSCGKVTTVVNPGPIC